MKWLAASNSIATHNLIVALICYACIKGGVATAGAAADGPPTDVDGAQLEQLKVAEELGELQRRLEELKHDVAQADAAPPAVANAGPRRQQRLTWQPLKRKRLTWQPLKRNAFNEGGGRQQQFTVKFRHTPELKQQLLDTIEEHLLEDLAAAQEYGIEPQLILQDLQNKHNDNAQ